MSVPFQQIRADPYPTVSFVVPARNEAAYITECIDSLRRQRSFCGAEIVVVDNGSTDATAALAVKAGAKVVAEPRAGLARARQAGWAAAAGEIVVYVDADTRLPASWTEEVLRLFAADRDLVAVSSGFTFYDGSRLQNLGSRVFRTLLVPAVNGFLCWAGRPTVLIGTAFAARADALGSAACFDAAFQFYGEDTRLACALQRVGEVRFIKRPLAQTSARRYRRHGVLLTTAKYFAMFALIQIGVLETAERLGQRMLAAEGRELHCEVSPRLAKSAFPDSNPIEFAAGEGAGTTRTTA